MASNVQERAEAYFKKDYSTWDVIAYLEFTLQNERVEHMVDLAIDSYLKDLEKVEDDGSIDQDRRQKASNLIHAYRNNGPDALRMKNWRSERIGDATSIVVNNSVGVGIFTGGNNSHVVINATKTTKRRRQPKKPKKSKKSKQSSRSNSEQLFHNRPGPSPLPLSASVFSKRFAEMDTNSMWVLPSGDLAEQVLYEGHRTTPYECLPHSFIIDLADPTVQKLYKPKDWVAICERVPKLPKKDESLGEVMRKFENLESPEQLRRILIESSYVPKVELYNHDMHYDASWVHLVFNFLLPLYDDPYPVLLEDHPEAWFDINIWSVVVDRCLQGLRGINMLRKETTSLAGSLRRNRDRTYPTQRQKMGPRYDGLAMDRSNRIEYAVMETSKAFHLEGATKWLHDYLKVAKCLHDILFLLHCEVNHEASLLEELQVAGLVSAGLDCQVLRMSYGGGYVCILSREKRRTIPATLSKSGQLLKLLFSIWRFKMIIKKLQDNCRLLWQR